MTNTTAWIAGRGAGLTWANAFNTADFTTSDGSGLLQNTHTVLSTIADIANGTALDMFADISVRLSIASSTVVAGACLSFWIYELLDDGATYGDGKLTAGTAAALTPAFAPCCAIPLFAAASQTSLVGFASGILVPPGSFRFAFQNNSGFTLTSSVTVCKYRTYNLNLNG